MLIRQFMDYNSRLDKETIENAKSQHFFAVPSATPKSSGNDTQGADVSQISFSIKNDVPGAGSFTAFIVVKNQGNAKAVGVQVLARPYRGILVGGTDQRMSHDPIHRLPENDPLSQFGKWVDFPDLAPGETSTQSVIFVNQPNVSPGNNPNPQITFETAKGNP